MERSIRLAGPALAAAAVLLAAGCSSSGDDKDGQGADQTGAGQTDSGESDDAAGDEDGGGDTGDGNPRLLDSAFVGVWAADDGGSLLHLGSDTLATLVLADEGCLGAASPAGGQTVISVKCTKSTDYGVGRAEVNDQVLTVDWEGSGARAYVWVADAGVDFADLDLAELGLEELAGFDPEDLNLGDLDLEELEDLLPPGNPIDIGGDSD